MSGSGSISVRGSGDAAYYSFHGMDPLALLARSRRGMENWSEGRKLRDVICQALLGLAEGILLHGID